MSNRILTRREKITLSQNPRPTQIPRGLNRDVTTTTTAGKCYFIPQRIPPELLKHIFDYCTTTTLNKLTHVSRYLVEWVSQHVSEILRANFINSQSSFPTFKEEVMPKFNTNSLMEQSIFFYCCSLRYLANPEASSDSKLVCSAYKETFDKLLELQAKILCQKKFTFEIINSDHYGVDRCKITFFYNYEKTNLYLLNANSMHIHFLINLIKVYFNFEYYESNLKNKKGRTTNTEILKFLDNNKLNSSISLLINDIVSDLCQTSILAGYEIFHNPLLNKFLEKNLFDTKTIQQLVNHSISRLGRNIPTDGSILDFIKSLLGAEHCIEDNNDAECLKNYIIKELLNRQINGLNSIRYVIALEICSRKNLSILNNSDIQLLINLFFKENIISNNDITNSPHILKLLKSVIKFDEKLTPYSEKISNLFFHIIDTITSMHVEDSNNIKEELLKNSIVLLIHIFSKFKIKINLNIFKKLTNKLFHTNVLKHPEILYLSLSLINKISNYYRYAADNSHKNTIAKNIVFAFGKNYDYSIDELIIISSFINDVVSYIDNDGIKIVKNYITKKLPIANKLNFIVFINLHSFFNPDELFALISIEDFQWFSKSVQTSRGTTYSTNIKIKFISFLQRFLSHSNKEIVDIATSSIKILEDVLSLDGPPITK